MIAGMVARSRANSILAITRLGKDRVRRSNCWRLPLESLGQQVMVIYIDIVVYSPQAENDLFA